MAFDVGERVIAQQTNRKRLGGLGSRALPAPRQGVVEEVLRGDPKPRYRVRWDDGGISVYAPTDSGLRPEPAG
jgi:hypothetical protein